MKPKIKIALVLLTLILVTPAALIGIFLTNLFVRIHFETEEKIAHALEGGYPHAAISINDRIDWDYTNQICFDVSLQPKSPGPTEKKIVMVIGDSDGGSWSLGQHEYDSMDECKGDFWRG